MGHPLTPLTAPPQVRRWRERRSPPNIAAAKPLTARPTSELKESGWIGIRRRRRDQGARPGRSPMIRRYCQSRCAPAGDEVARQRGEGDGLVPQINAVSNLLPAHVTYRIPVKNDQDSCTPCRADATLRSVGRVAGGRPRGGGRETPEITHTCGAARSYGGDRRRRRGTRGGLGGAVEHALHRYPARRATWIADVPGAVERAPVACTATGSAR